MNYKQLEKANHLLQQVRTLDREIIDIDRLALLIAGGEVQLELSLQVTDLQRKAEAEGKVSFDEDGSLRLGGSSYEEIKRQMMDRMYPSFLLSFGEVKKPEEDKNSLKAAVTESVALQVLGVLLSEKQTRRDGLLARLRTMGVE